MQRQLPIVVVLGVAILAAACATSSAAPKSAADPPVTLSVGTVDSAGQPMANQLAYFADQVGKASNGSVTIKVLLDAFDVQAHNDPLATLLDHVKSGDLDMILIGSPAWDTHGVTSLQAIEAPSLIDSDTLMDAVASSDLVKPMLAGLDSAGMKGIALWPEALRHPAGLGAPLLSLADFKGATIRLPLDGVESSVISSFGGTAAVLNGDPFQAAITGHLLKGAETSYARSFDQYPGGTTITANVSLYARMPVLSISTAAYARLSSAQQQALAAAAASTLSHLVDTNLTEAAAGAAFCAKGGTIVAASSTDVAAFIQAAAPVTTTLEKDPLTKQIIGQISDLKAKSAAPTPAAECARTAVRSASPSPTPSPRPQGTPASLLPDGVYRTSVTLKELQDAEAANGPTWDGPAYGYTTLAESDLESLAGVVTMTLSAGRGSMQFTGTSATFFETVVGDAVRFNQTPAANEWLVGYSDLQWSLSGSDLHLNDVTVAPADDPAFVWIFRQPWKKIK